MGKIPLFDNLTKPQEDLIGKGYTYGSLATVGIFSNLQKKRGEWKVKGSQRQDEANETITFASGAIKLRKKKTWFRVKKTNDQRTKLSAQYVPSKAKKVKINGDLDADQKAGTYGGVVSFAYEGKRAASMLTLSNGPTIKGNATVGTKKYGFGVDGTASSKAGRLTSYNAALWWKNKNCMLVAKHLGTNDKVYEWGDFVLSYFYKAGKSAKFGGTVTTNWNSKDTKIEFGGRYKDKAKVLYQGKIDQEGNIGLSFAKKLKSLGLLTVSTLINPKSVSENGTTDHKLGFRLDFKK